jgi:zinc transport system substrate-binding protein
VPSQHRTRWLLAPTVKLMRFTNMQTAIAKRLGALALGSILLITAQAQAQSSGGSGDASSAHEQSHAHGSDDAIYNGYFNDEQIEARTLADWQGDWQSVYPYLTSGALDPVMAHKAEHGDMSAEEYRAYYETGYKTDVDRIVIDGDSFTFYKAGETFTGRYGQDGYEILTYEKGNRGVRYIFEKTEGDEAAPQFVQFSDHIIAPTKSDHFHLYWGDDRTALLQEVTKWPTYYPSSLSDDEIISEMTAH